MNVAGSYWQKIMEKKSVEKIWEISGEKKFSGENSAESIRMK